LPVDFGEWQLAKTNMQQISSDIDAYLATLSAENRAALEKLRRSIKAALPEAEECIAYGIPAFRWNGKPVAGFSASKNHCSYFPMSGSVVAALQEELKKYDSSKGTIRFPASKPLSAALVKQLVKARLAEIEDQGKPKPKKKKSK
jgi:uncharacterized protein YdhG (YjbR/CyaY superfamily)